jgi:small-conductance mechanosensitive channel
MAGLPSRATGRGCIVPIDVGMTRHRACGTQPAASRLARLFHAAARVVLLGLAGGVGVAMAADEAPRPDGAAIGSGAPAAAGVHAAGAQAAGAQTAGAKTAKVEGTDAPRAGEGRAEGRLVVFNRPIFVFRSAFLGVPPAERAEAARHRIIATLERGSEGNVTVEAMTGGAIVKVDGRLAFIIANDDVEALAGDHESRDAAARAAARALEGAIAATKEARDARSRAGAVTAAGVATAIFAGVLWLLRWLGSAVTARLLRLTAASAGHLKIGGSEIVRRDRLLRAVSQLLRLAYWAVVLLVTYEWLGYVLGLFPFTRPWGEQLNTFLVEMLLDMLAAIAGAVPDLVVVAVIFVLAHTLNGLLRNFFAGVQSRRIQVNWLDPDSARPTRRLVSIGVWVFALVMAYPYIPGSDSEAFKGLSVLIGLMVSIGGSGLVGQAASGLILMYTRTFRPGEYVRVADHEGTVVEMGMFTTRVRTGLGEELTLPNSLILGAVTMNYSRVVRGAGFVLDATVTIGYDAPWRQVHAMLVEAARRTPGVLPEPAPHVFQTALSDFYVEYRLICQGVPSEPRPRAQVLSDLHASIQDVFNEHGVQIMSPHYLGDPAVGKVVPKERWYAPPAEPPA